MCFNAIEKSFNDIACLIKFFVKVVKVDSIWFVGNTGGGFEIYLRISSEQKALSAKIFFRQCSFFQAILWHICCHEIVRHSNVESISTR